MISLARLASVPPLLVTMMPRLRQLSLYSVLAGVTVLLGFLREIVIASEFGLSAELDVYVAVLGFHLFLGTQVGNALETAFISKVAKEGETVHASEQLICTLQSLILANLAMALLLIVLAVPLIGTIFPGFDREQSRLGANILYLFVLAIASSNIAGLVRGALHVLRQFTPGFLAGAITSVLSIVCVLSLARHLGIHAVVLGVVLGNLLVLVCFTVVLVNRGGFPWRSLWPVRLRVSPIWSATAVVLLSEFLFQAYAMTERAFASTLDTGTISSFYYAYSLVSVPATLVVAPLTTTVFPRLAESFGKQKSDGIRLLKRYGAILMVFALCTSAIVWLFADPIVRLVFVRGNFSLQDAAKTAQILSTLVFLLPFISVARLIRYSLYSLSGYLAPVYGNLFTWLILAVAASILVPAYGARGLALAAVLAIAGGTCLLAFSLIRRLRVRGA